MNDDDFGDGYGSNEYARASAESLMFHPIVNERAKGVALAREGRFVVMCSYPHYCRVTSAVVGEGVFIQGVFDCFKDAYDKHFKDLFPLNREDHDPDAQYWIESQETILRAEAKELMRLAEIEAQLQWERDHPEDVVPF